MVGPDLSFMHPFFLGAYAENDQIFEKIMLEFFRDHAYWRRNFHPQNRPPIPTTAQYTQGYNEFLAEMQQELQKLSADLKKSVPFFSPRYLGHMVADLLLPGVLAQIMTILYNPNNVSDDAAPATLDKEIEVGNMLARMVGFNLEAGKGPIAWGHLTSGGTVANYESLWNFEAVKFYPVSMAETARAFGVDFDGVGPRKQRLSQYDKWELCNFSIRETVELMRTGLGQMKSATDKKEFQKFTSHLKAEGLGSLGYAGFFLRHRDLKQPKVLLPLSAHYSWEKSARVLGLGTAQLEQIRLDSHMRMRADHLEEVVLRCRQEQQPLLAVVGVLGSTEFGSVDPIHEIVDLRARCQSAGQFFGIHVDGAWGGYMISIFRQKDGSFMDHPEIRKEFKYFPKEGTWRAFEAVSRADSVTVDPHKLGYLPFGCGAFISRDVGILDFISQEATYVFDVDPFKKSLREKLKRLGKYIMEGSKPGASAAAAYVAHRVVPLHTLGFGRVLIHSMRSCEYLFDRLHELKERLKPMITLTLPYTPDTNLLCFTLNPVKNRDLALMNHFTRKIFDRIKINREQPLQGHEFFGSFTSLRKGKLDESEANRILTDLGIDPATFTDHIEEMTRDADHIFLIRHTLMNPWLMHQDDQDGGGNYLDRYCHFLEQCIVDAMRPNEKMRRLPPLADVE